MAKKQGKLKGPVKEQNESGCLGPTFPTQAVADAAGDGIGALKLVDLFSGAGGLSCGLNMAGFHSVLGSDIHPVYAQTFAKNHPEAQVITNDIRELSEHNILELTGLRPGELDLIAGGPPCQGFSINAPIRSLEDQRNHLFKEYLRIAGILKPRAILIENVPGLVSLGRGTVVTEIYKCLNAMGYTVDHRGRTQPPLEAEHHDQADGRHSRRHGTFDEVHPLRHHRRQARRRERQTHCRLGPDYLPGRCVVAADSF